MLRRCVGTLFISPPHKGRMEQDHAPGSPSPCGRGVGGGDTPPRLLHHARTMRRDPTRGEARLWRALRTRQIDGLKFRRQVPIGPFIADFFCPAMRLVVEIDGATHTDSVADAARDRWMHAQGLVVLRFWGDDVADNLGGVLARIRELAAARRR